MHFPILIEDKGKSKKTKKSLQYLCKDFFMPILKILIDDCKQSFFAVDDFIKKQGNATEPYIHISTLNEEKPTIKLASRGGFMKKFSN